MYYILNKNDKEACEEYENFVSNHVNGNFMQSLNWTGVKNNWKWEAVISRDKYKKIRGTALILIKKIPILGCSFLYSPHGPVYDYEDADTLKEILLGIEIIRKKYKGYELRIDPCFTENDKKYIDIIKKRRL